MDFLADERRRAFSLWLRTGRLPGWARPRKAEAKYNPWHDPDDGRFTHAGTGRYFGRGSAGGAAARSPDASHSRERRKRGFGGYAGGGPGFNNGGASGSWPAPEGEAQQRREQRPAKPGPGPTSRTAPVERPGNTRSSGRRNWRRIEKNGYAWWIDSSGLFRQVDGTLTFSDTPRRSRAAQRRAGHPDRRISDDGGHYIAPRFNGPSDAFNHFAQDRNFNRGAYRALEDQWARALRAGKRVDVKIAPVYDGASRRPSYINVWFWIDGHLESLKFPNEPQGRRNAKR